MASPDSSKGVSHQTGRDHPMPSVDALREIMERLKAVLFPGFFGDHEITPSTMGFHLGSQLDRVMRLVREQVRRGFCFICEPDREERDCRECDERAGELAAAFLRSLPSVRESLAGDVEAAHRGDPASRSPGETIFCYPSITALTHHRVAHELQKLGVVIIPRIIGEMAHSVTGIDIHPGADIGPNFFIDHGTGVVIGETCVIGRDVRIYQGVTLGAKSFPKDESGRLIKGQPRHPVVEDDVVIYSGATILGRVTIGAGSTIGGNVWLTRSVPPGSTILQRGGNLERFTQGAGI
nr:serine O-acetyltransferase EpsC [Desulfohalovibrio reitneri]